MSTNRNEVTEEGAPTYLGKGTPVPGLIVTEFNSVSVDSTEYRPVWLSALADDVTLEGSMMDGAVRGPEAVRSIVGYIRTLYENQSFNFAGPYGDNGFLEDYSAEVRGKPIGGVVLVTRNAAGQAQHIAANYRPRSTLLLLSRLIGDHFTGTPYGEHFATSLDEEKGAASITAD
jgi:hypothetical protein